MLLSFNCTEAKRSRCKWTSEWRTMFFNLCTFSAKCGTLRLNYMDYKKFMMGNAVACFALKMRFLTRFSSVENKYELPLTETVLDFERIFNDSERSLFLICSRQTSYESSPTANFIFLHLSKPNLLGPSLWLTTLLIVRWNLWLAIKHRSSSKCMFSKPLGQKS